MPCRHGWRKALYACWGNESGKSEWLSFNDAHQKKCQKAMKVYFIGAGPGAADLITLRGAQILSRASVVLYAGSLVSKEMLVHCRGGAKIINTAHLNLEEQEAYYID